MMSRTIQSHLICFLLIVSSLFFSTSSVFAQYNNLFKKPEKSNSGNSLPDAEAKKLINDIYQLSSANMKGRIMGTSGEQMAITLIAKRFKEIGLKEIDKNYTRKFSYSVGASISDLSHISIGKNTIKVPQEGFPLAFTDTQRVNTFIVRESNEFQSVWIIPAFSSRDELRKTPEEKEKMLYEKALNAKKRGAIGIVFYNNLEDNFICTFKKETDLPNIGIPVFEISRTAYSNYFSQLNKLTSLKLHPVIAQDLKQGYNLYGVINNGAQKTVVISANYDGYLPEGMTAKEAESLPNANYNASGAASLLALAERLIKVKSSYNYIFILYSGSYRGQAGSRALFSDKNFFTQNLAFAIHFDAIGRLDQRKKDIFVSGVGTYAGWRSYFGGHTHNDISFVMESKGSDSSDFQTYYDYKLPYLRFTTGPNEDIGTVDDVPHKINLDGMGEIINKCYYILAEISNTQPNIAFIEAKDQYEKKSGNVKNLANPVSLGITPDLRYSESGLKVVTVNKGQAAAKAGILGGDVIIQIRNFPVQNYDDYIDAMSKFKKGDKVFIKLIRKGNTIQKLVTFS